MRMKNCINHSQNKIWLILGQIFLIYSKIKRRIMVSVQKILVIYTNMLIDWTLKHHYAPITYNTYEYDLFNNLSLKFKFINMYKQSSNCENILKIIFYLEKYYTSICYFISYIFILVFLMTRQQKYF